VCVCKFGLVSRAGEFAGLKILLASNGIFLNRGNYDSLAQYTKMLFSITKEPSGRERASEEAELFFAMLKINIRASAKSSLEDSFSLCFAPPLTPLFQCTISAVVIFLSSCMIKKTHLLFSKHQKVSKNGLNLSPLIFSEVRNVLFSF
jgi:hypothetical protein